MLEICRIFGITVLTVTAVIVGNLLPASGRLHQMAQAAYRRRLDNLLEKAVKQIRLLTIQTKAIESELDAELRINESLLRDVKDLRARVEALEKPTKIKKKLPLP